jgi:hypothetical protein
MPNWNAGPWGVLNQLNPDLMTMLNQAFVAASTRLRTGGMSAAALYQGALSRVDATQAYSIGAVLGAIIDFTAGYYITLANALTGGLAGRLFGELSSLTGLSFTGLVNTSSTLAALSPFGSGGTDFAVELCCRHPFFTEKPSRRPCCGGAN